MWKARVLSNKSDIVKHKYKVGKVFDVCNIQDSLCYGKTFAIVDDPDNFCIRMQNSIHLGGGNWQLFELTEVEAERMKDHVSYYKYKGVLVHMNFIDTGKWTADGFDYMPESDLLAAIDKAQEPENPAVLKHKTYKGFELVPDSDLPKDNVHAIKDGKYLRDPSNLRLTNTKSKGWHKKHITNRIDKFLAKESEAGGFAVGDSVRVIRGPKAGENFPTANWKRDMDRYVGKVWTVEKVSPKGNYLLGGRWYFHPDVLERAEDKFCVPAAKLEISSGEPDDEPGKITFTFTKENKMSKFKKAMKIVKWVAIVNLAHDIYPYATPAVTHTVNFVHTRTGLLPDLVLSSGQCWAIVAGVTGVLVGGRFLAKKALKGKSVWDFA